jgi:hypothetical protein
VIRFLSWLTGALILLVLAAGGLLLAAVDSQPLVERSESISPASIAQARWLFNSNDPRRLRAGEARRIAIPAALLDEGVNYLANRLHGSGALALGEESAEIRLTRQVPLLPGKHYLNLRASLREGDGEPRIVAARLGSLALPPQLLEFAIAAAVQSAGYETEWKLVRGAIRELVFEPARQQVIVSYVWEPALLDRARSIALNPDDLVRIRSAQEALAALLDHQAAGKAVALVDILSPMLDLDGGDQRLNRRAALVVLAAYLAEKNLTSLIPDARDWPQPRPVELKLGGRYDSAQHFIISATLAAWAGEPVADAIGVYKELDDSRHGSGFSFADLAADRAGTRFGELLNRDEPRLSKLLQAGIADRDLLPLQNDLPEYIYAPDFRRRFGDTRSAAYRQLIDEIERRLDAIPLYRPEGK